MTVSATLLPLTRALVWGGWAQLSPGVFRQRVTCAVCFSLLQRVCRFRGVNKEKGEMNAASWFTRPGK